MSIQLAILRRASAGDTPRWVSYDYEPRTDADTVATALTELNKTLADPIRWEHSCLQKKCGACAMVINGRPGLACDARLSDYKGVVQVEPLRKFPVVADLLVDRSALYESLAALQVWLTENAQTGEKRNDLAFEASRCLQCGCCLEVCPNYDPGTAPGGFAGMAGAVPLARLLAQLPEGQKKELAGAYEKHVFAGCGKSLSCRNICPAGIDMDKVLSASSAIAVWKRFLKG